MKRKLTLQWRVALLTALILFITSLSITVFSICSANKMLEYIVDSPIVSTIPAVPAVPYEGEDYTDYALGIPAQTAKRAFDYRGILFCIAATIVGTTLSYWVAGRALNPIKQLSKKIAEIDETSLSERLPEAQTKDEIGKMTGQFNHMLARLEDAFQRQKRFSASAAHELKTPLATMKAGLQVLQRDKNATLVDYRENANVTVASVDRLNRIVNDLLLLSSVEERKQNCFEEIDLAEMLDVIFTELSEAYSAKDISYQVDCKIPILSGNTTQIFRMFYNLIENAYKYNIQHGNITINAKNSHDVAVIKVADTGCGIPEEHIPYLFDAFYRVDDSRSRKTAGAGLGLSLVKTIVEHHGGTITVQSTLHGGTTFNIELPQ